MTQIAFQVNSQDLVALSNTCRLFRDASSAARYETVTFGWAVGVDDDGNIDIDGLVNLQRVVREMLADLASNELKLSSLRTLRLLEYSWMGEEEIELLKQVVDRATGLEVLQMVSSLGAELGSPPYPRYCRP